jgi:hypothetical protein
LTSVELFDYPEIRKHATDINAVSDYCGHFYRRGFLSRVSVRGPGKAKYAYSFKGKSLDVLPQAREAQPRFAPKIVKTDPKAVEEVRKMQREVEVAAPRKAELSVSQEGDTLVLETPTMTLRITTRDRTA